MIERNGNIFDSDAGYLAHGVNTKGVMGAGIAKAFRERFGEEYFYSYYTDCKYGILRPGEFTRWKTKFKDKDIMVLNLASQRKPGPDAEYTWLFDCLRTVAEQVMMNSKYILPDYGTTIAIPEIGCGIGGLEWAKVKSLIETVEVLVPGIEFEVWHYA